MVKLCGKKIPKNEFVGHFCNVHIFKRNWFIDQYVTEDIKISFNKNKKN